MLFKEYVEMVMRADRDMLPDVPKFVDSALRYASNPLNGKGKPNWMHNNYQYFMDNRDKLIQMVNDYVQRKVPSFQNMPFSRRGTIVSDFVRQQFQKEQGFGTRRNVAYAASQDVDPVTVLHPDTINMGSGDSPYRRPEARPRGKMSPEAYKKYIRTRYGKKAGFKEWCEENFS